MFVQKVPHIKDQFLTQERASMELESGQIAVGWYTNEQDSQSVVHSHPYYELVLPLVGSNVRYSVDGNIYDINLGEMIIFPARCYHAGMFNITDKISERLIAQINAELWQEALLASGLVAPTWLGQLVILDADAVTAWDLRGLFERMAQTAYLHGSTQRMDFPHGRQSSRASMKVKGVATLSRSPVSARKSTPESSSARSTAAAAQRIMTRNDGRFMVNPLRISVRFAQAAASSTGSCSGRRGKSLKA